MSSMWPNKRICGGHPVDAAGEGENKRLNWRPQAAKVPHDGARGGLARQVGEASGR